MRQKRTDGGGDTADGCWCETDRRPHCPPPWPLTSSVHVTGSVTLCWAAKQTFSPQRWWSRWCLYLITEFGFIEICPNFPGERVKKKQGKEPQDTVDIFRFSDGFIEWLCCCCDSNVCRNRADDLPNTANNTWHDERAPYQKSAQPPSHLHRRRVELLVDAKTCRISEQRPARQLLIWHEVWIGVKNLQHLHLLLCLLASLWAWIHLVLTFPERHLGFICINVLLLLFDAGWERNEAWRISNISSNPGLTRPPAS